MPQVNPYTAYEGSLMTEVEPAVERARRSLGQLGVATFQALAQQEQSGNLLIFPISIHPVILMMLAGARGATRKRLAEMIGIDADAAFGEEFLELVKAARAHPQFSLDVQNKFWHREGLTIEQTFIEFCRSMEVNLAPANFNDPKGTADAFNAWVAEATKGLITRFVEPESITPDLVALASNVTYFKGEWLQPFKKYRTHDAPFAGRRGTSTVRMMGSSNLPIRAFTLPFCTGIDLPMHGASLQFLRPSDGTTIDQLVSGLDIGMVDEIEMQLRGGSMRPYDIYIPNFKLETGNVELMDVLCNLGLHGLFGGGDLTGITPEANMALSSLLHKAVLKVDESGAEGAAVTGGRMVTTSLRPPCPEFRLDRSFLVIVRDQTRSIVAIGRVEDLS
jgi:serpin B